MTNIKIQDGADEFRISLQGRFAGASVQEVRQTWTAKLAECSASRFTIDISELSDYDASGRKLLRDMYHHGIHFAASTPNSLVLLSEISSPRRWSVTMLPEQSADRALTRARTNTTDVNSTEVNEDLRALKTRIAGK